MLFRGQRCKTEVEGKFAWWALLGAGNRFGRGPDKSLCPTCPTPQTVAAKGPTETGYGRLRQSQQQLVRFWSRTRAGPLMWRFLLLHARLPHARLSIPAPLHAVAPPLFSHSAQCYASKKKCVHTSTDYSLPCERCGTMGKLCSPPGSLPPRDRRQGADSPKTTFPMLNPIATCLSPGTSFQTGLGSSPFFVSGNPWMLLSPALELDDSASLANLAYRSRLDSPGLLAAGMAIREAFLKASAPSMLQTGAINILPSMPGTSPSEAELSLFYGVWQNRVIRRHLVVGWSYTESRHCRSLRRSARTVPCRLLELPILHQSCCPPSNFQLCLCHWRC